MKNRAIASMGVKYKKKKKYKNLLNIAKNRHASELAKVCKYPNSLQ